MEDLENPSVGFTQLAELEGLAECADRWVAGRVVAHQQLTQCESAATKADALKRCIGATEEETSVLHRSDAFTNSHTFCTVTHIGPYMNCTFVM